MQRIEEVEEPFWKFPAFLHSLAVVKIDNHNSGKGYSHHAGQWIKNIDTNGKHADAIYKCEKSK